MDTPVGYTSRFLSYDFDGNLLKDIRYANSEWRQAYLLDSVTVMVNTDVDSRFQPSRTKKLILQDYDRKTLKSFPSYLYPVERPRGNFAYGAGNILWRCGKDFYLLEYGNDTIFQITREQLIPALIQKGQSDHSPANAEAFFRHIRIKPFFDCQLAQEVPQGKLFCRFRQKDGQFVADRQTYTTFYRRTGTLQDFRVFYRRHGVRSAR